MGLWWWDHGNPPTWSYEQALLLFSLVLWQPVIEEIGFRGMLQGVLREQSGCQLFMGPLTVANLLTSTVFALAHLPTHPWFWIPGIFIISIILGYARDRSGSLFPAIGLHCYFNTGYFLVTGPP